MTEAQRLRGTGAARAALAGNPSDGYGGAVLALSLNTWHAEAEAEADVVGSIKPDNLLVRATVDRFTRELGPAAARSAVRWTTTIPQRVGLGSSSALVIAVTRALSALHGIDLDPVRLADFAFAVETEELDIVAGLQDRVVQAYEGLMFMDFGQPRRYERLDQGLLPPLVIAWREAAAGHSGDVHGNLRDRHRQGERAVHAAMSELAAAARTARTALLEADLDRFGESMDATFDLRRQLMELDPLCVEMVEAARALGASANYTGSGGAIVAACRAESQAEEVRQALARIGCGTVRAGTG